VSEWNKSAEILSGVPKHQVDGQSIDGQTFDRESDPMRQVLEALKMVLKGSSSYDTPFLVGITLPSGCACELLVKVSTPNTHRGAVATFMMMPKREEFDANSTLQQKLKTVAHSTAAKMLRQTIAFRTRGEMGLRIVTWRDQCSAARQAATLQAQLKEKDIETGLQLLRQIVAFVMKGEIGMRLIVWRSR